jgi:hypothetical protein
MTKLESAMQEVEEQARLPVYEHDCNLCIYRGTFILERYEGEELVSTLADLYLSCQGYLEETKGMKWVIRMSSEGSDYVTTDRLEVYLT